MSRYLFIDGAFFENTFSAMLQNMFPSENLFTAINLSKMTAPYDRAFYYDALPAKKSSESDTDWQSRYAKKEELFNNLSMSPNLHVRSGVSRYRRRYRGLEQKGVDILLAIEVLQHATLGNIDEAYFILSDLDFYPIFDALIQTRVKSHLFYHPHKTSKELIYAADVAEPVNAGTLNQWLRDDLMSQTELARNMGEFPPKFTQEPTVKCNDRDILIRQTTTGWYAASYMDNINMSNNTYYVSKIPYLLLNVFEDAPGRKVTGAAQFGFP